jgi:hypothetical protein
MYLDDVAANCETVHRDPAIAEVTFTRPLLVAEVVQLSNQHNAEIAVLEGDFEVGTQPIHDFYVTPSEGTPAEIEQAYEENRLAYFQDAVNDIEGMQPEDQAEQQSLLLAMKAALAINDAGLVTVSGATLSGKREDLQTLDASSDTALTDAIARVVIADAGDAQLQSLTENVDAEEDFPESADELVTTAGGLSEESSSDGTMTAASSGTYYPNVGYFRILASWNFPGHRFSGQWFKWYNDTLTSNDTYEHDVFLDNRDNETYMTRRNTTWPYCYPYKWYASTSLPQSSGLYIDTNFTQSGHCQPDFRAYTIGLLYGDKVSSGVWYHTYVRTPNGNEGGDGAFLRGQVGHREGCAWRPRAFCSFGDARRDLLGRQPTKTQGGCSTTYQPTGGSGTSRQVAQDPLI